MLERGSGIVEEAWREWTAVAIEAQLDIRLSGQSSIVRALSLPRLTIRRGAQLHASGCRMAFYIHASNGIARVRQVIRRSHNDGLPRTLKGNAGRKERGGRWPEQSKLCGSGSGSGPFRSLHFWLVWG